MKKLKIFLAAVLMMVLAMNMTVFAADITINDGVADGSTYSAYKLLNADVSEDGSVAYTLNSKYAELLTEATGKTAEQEIVAEIANHSDAGSIRSFADILYGHLTETTLAADIITETNKFESAEQGYYLIVETAVGDNDTYSLVMLDTAGKDDITITTKEDVPTLEKKVQETNDTAGTTTDWQDAADYDIADAVPFKLTGTLPSDYDNYETYYYAFRDQLSAGLAFNNDAVVKVDGTVLTSGYEVVTSGLADGYTFEVRFANLKSITNVTESSVITVEYTATMNSNAVIGSAGNPNVAKLEYSNNPYYEGTGKGETSETPDDKVIVFTYQLTVDKVNAAGNPLEGAGFTLYKSVNNSDVAVGSEIKGEGITSFEFKGLDAGTYKLVETTVPTGYNKADDMEFEIVATYDTEADNPGLTSLVVKDGEGNTISGTADAVVTIQDGKLFVEIENVSGLLLPTTGGIGTIVFYVVGAALMIGAVVLMIKRRKSN